MKLIPFITAGHPSPIKFWDVLRELDDNGADVIEIGVPFTDPVADGPVIEAASQQAIANGVTLRWILDGLRERRGSFKAKIVLMGYLNPFLQYGLLSFHALNTGKNACAPFERLADEAAEIGVYGFVIPDLPLDEDAEYRAALQARGIHLIPLVAPNTPLERMWQYAAVATGYVYVVSVLGTTGERRGGLPEGVRATLARARRAFTLPIALGFGFSEPAQLDTIPAGERPDAVVFGSALVRHLSEGGSAAEFMRRWA